MLLAVFLSGCSKEPIAPSTPELQPVIGERYDPAVEETLPLILEFKRKKEAHALGAKSDNGEVPLQEAIWLAEALMNYSKGDASRSGSAWLNGTVSYSFPYFLKADGSVWLNEEDLYDSYDAAMQQVNAAVGEGKIYLMDHELISIEEGMATMQINWVDKDPSAEYPEPYEPTGHGCHNAATAAGILTYLLNWNYHGVAAVDGAFYLAISPVLEETDNNVVPPNSYGVGPSYWGQAVGAGGHNLIYNGQNTSPELCFPARWNKTVLMRNIIIEAMAVDPPYEIVVEWFDANYDPVDPWGLPPGYPLQPWHHQYLYKVGRLVRP